MCEWWGKEREFIDKELPLEVDVRWQFMLPMSTESRKSSPNSSQHWCLHNLEVSKVVVKGFADVLVLLLWAVLPWSASCCPSHLIANESCCLLFHFCSLFHDLCICCLYELPYCLLLHLVDSKWFSPLPSYSFILYAELRSAVMHCCCLQVSHPDSMSYFDVVYWYSNGISEWALMVCS